MGEQTLTEVQPDALDRVQLGCVGRQWDRADVWRHDEIARPLPSGAVEHERNLRIRCNRGGEVVEEDLHGRGRDLWQYEGEAVAGGGADGAEQVGPLVALLAQAARPFAAYPPAVASAALRANPGLIFEPQLDALAGMRRGDRLYGPQQPPLTKAALARSSAWGCSGRVFCRDRSSRRTIRDRLAGCRRLSKRSSIQRQSAGSVQSVQP
jgi:hypothetical protein